MAHNHKVQVKKCRCWAPAKRKLSKIRVFREFKGLTPVPAEKERGTTPAGSRLDSVSVATAYFLGRFEGAQKVLGASGCCHVGTAGWVVVGSRSRKHIAPPAKAVNCPRPCDLRTTLCDDLTSDRRTSVTSGKCADWGGFEGQGKCEICYHTWEPGLYFAEKYFDLFQSLIFGYS